MELHLECKADLISLYLSRLAFRDHPPQDYTYVTKNFGFTSDVGTIKEHLKELYASGGGDGPEAVTAALHSTLLMDWRENATRLAVLIADAPPHGIGEVSRDVEVQQLAWSFRADDDFLVDQSIDPPVRRWLLRWLS